MSILASRAIEVEKAGLLDWLEATGFNAIYGTLEGGGDGWFVSESDANVGIAEAPTLVEALRKARQAVSEREAADDEATHE